MRGDRVSKNEPKALKKLNELTNITIKMYDVDQAGDGFHTKGYIFKSEEIYRVIIGSSNMTRSALTTNREWNTKIVSTEHGEIIKDIVAEFEQLWNSSCALDFDSFYETYEENYKVVRHQREIAKQDSVVSLDKYRLKPNSMQLGFIKNLKKILQNGEERALLISATGTGKSYASAFAMRELGFRRVLFLVHRGQLAKQTKRSYENIFPKSVSMGLVGAGYHEYDKDYVFATVQTINKDVHLLQYKPDEFECIILDEAHHSSADIYQKVMQYFKPKLWLGMTATPDKREDGENGRNIYEIFHYQIAYEIRLQQAMEEDLLCPFHYFGISEVSMLGDDSMSSKKLKEAEFNLLVGEERVNHIIQQANYYGYSGDKVKGLVFCSRIDESEELSEKFNQRINPETGEYYRTIALNGSASEEERQAAFERLAMNEEDATDEMTPLDYIFSVEILNEGVDIVEVNQVIMLRPTESPIVFIQQLGRGLRKAEGKEFVVILDFIGNYNNNFMIPIALSGDRSYNPDTIRKYVISGNNTIPGASTVHFDEIAKNKIFASIDKIKGIRTIIKGSYVTLKNRLGRLPYLIDFYENGEVDPLLIIKEYKTYQNFLKSMEGASYHGKVGEKELDALEYLSKTVLSGVRPHELEILRCLLRTGAVDYSSVRDDFYRKYGYDMEAEDYDHAVAVLKGNFVGKQEERQRYTNAAILEEVVDPKTQMHRYERLRTTLNRIYQKEFLRQVDDIVEVGLRRYHDIYLAGRNEDSPFVLYEKYSRRDVCFLMNYGSDISSTMYGMKKIGDDVFLFVTYHKEQRADEKEYVDGKPDYADAFVDNMIFNWDSQIGKGIESGYVADVTQTKAKHLLVKKSSAESNFYYMGQFDVVDIKAAKKKDNNGKLRDITKFQMKLHHAVRDDLLRYFQSDVEA